MIPGLFDPAAWMALATDPAAWAALATLAALEIVLGIDNIVFISVLVAKLPEAAARRARQIGLALALIFRIALLMVLTAIMGLTATVLSVAGQDLSWRDIILIGGGLFLLAKATHEIHNEIEGSDGGGSDAGKAAGAAFAIVIGQVIVIDLVFSIDSIVTAIGMAQDIRIMVIAVLIAVAVMYVASGPVAAFVKAHPTTKMLALAFLLLIGVALIADGLGVHIPRGYIYFAMVFAGAVETFNILSKRNRRRAVDEATGLGG
jgi:predicted tellurium resistance membrane protein TerC